MLTGGLAGGKARHRQGFAGGTWPYGVVPEGRWGRCGDAGQRKKGGENPPFMGKR